MVYAGSEAFNAKTFAALPVGAMSMVFCFISTIAFTMALARVVFPVPADPRSIIATRSLRSSIKSAKRHIAVDCSAVG